MLEKIYNITLLVLIVVTAGFLAIESGKGMDNTSNAEVTAQVQP